MLPLFLSFFFFIPPNCIADQSQDALRLVEELHLEADPTWRALLHHARGRCFVNDKAYYLAGSECALGEEIRALVQAAFSIDASIRKDVACRFPARVQFVRDRLALHGVSVPVTRCPEFEEYVLKAPADDISLVFASENITHPMSMMGHVFLKFAGTSQQGEKLEHAASFFTRISTFNVPALIMDGMFLGMPAFFALVPYAEQIKGYREMEGRNIFEYPVRSTDTQRRLIHAHVWELKNIKSPYLFVGYNCATVVYFIVSLAQPQLLDQLGLWISPIDVVRKSKELDIIDTRNFIPSVDWKVRFFGQALGHTAAFEVMRNLEVAPFEQIREMTNAEEDPLRRAFAEALVERENSRPRLPSERIKGLSRALFDEPLSSPSTAFEVENLKDPTGGPHSSRVSLGAVHFDGTAYAKLEFLPASHSLWDDNRRSYSESALELGQGSILFNPDGERAIVVERINLYGMESFVPHDRYIGGTSSRLIIGVQQEWDGSLSPYTAGHVTAGLGKALQLSNDSNLYGMINSALSYGDGRLMLSYFPELGATLYEILSMKTVVSYRLQCGQHGSKGCYQSINAAQSLFLRADMAPYVGFSNMWSDDGSAQVYEVGVRLSF
jgi:hypothetical protein